MLKIAYQLGVQAAFDEAGLSELTKEAAGGKTGLLGRAWKGFRNMSPWKQTAIGTGLGAGALGTGLALMPGEEEPSTLQRVGDTAKSFLADKGLMLGLTQSLAGGLGGGGGLGLTPMGGQQSFPPSPEGIPDPSMQTYQEPYGQYPEGYV